MTTTTFTPSPNAPFIFQASLDGTAYNVTVLWNVFGQRWYVQVTDQNNTLVFFRPMVWSPPGTPISLTAGYFASTMTFDGTAFTVLP